MPEMPAYYICSFLCMNYALFSAYYASNTLTATFLFLARFKSFGTCSLSRRFTTFLCSVCSLSDSEPGRLPHSLVVDVNELAIYSCGMPCGIAQCACATCGSTIMCSMPIMPGKYAGINRRKPSMVTAFIQ